MDPIAILYGEIFKSAITFNYYIIGNYFLLVSVLWNKNKPEINYSLIVGGIFFIILLFTINFSTKDHLLITVVIQVVLLFIFLKNFIVEYAFNSRLNLFYLILVFYILTIISKFLIIFLNLANASAFFHITTIAQIVFGLFFSIYREDKQGDSV